MKMDYLLIVWIKLVIYTEKEKAYFYLRWSTKIYFRFMGYMKNKNLQPLEQKRIFYDLEYRRIF